MTQQFDRAGPSPRNTGIGRRTLLRAGGVLGAAGALGALTNPAYGAGRPDHWLRPGDEGYDAAVSGFNTTVTRRPEAVVLARDAEDVQQAVRYAGREDLPVCVMATGHQASVSFEGGILVSTAAMDGVRVDQHSSSVRVGPGAQWGPIAEATAPHGLAGLVGSSVSVGAVGYTLGGGLSPTFGRLHGYAADHVSRLEIVTADGELRVATPEQEQDLFWAARGGKGNFGIVTSLDFGLFPVRTLYAGAIMYPAEVAREVLPAWRDWAAEAPESVTTSAAFVEIPPDAPLPDDVRGRRVVSVRVSYVGDTDEGARLVAPLRDAGPVLLDSVDEMPFTDWDIIHSDPEGPIPAYERTSLLGELPDLALEVMIELAGADSGSPMDLVEVRQLGGALARDPEVPNAVGHRDAAFTFFTIGLAPPEQVEEVRAHGALLVEAMEPWGIGGAYVNFLSSDEADPADVERAYAPEVYERLVSVKSDVDSDNMFRLTHNIPPG
ncbi:FAD-binding oxidoreductase [Nocardiopsis sp. HNM0947]|uniref:FAD-binding oxidoreductase n=1 Tax=Nocardiopsis coralli TaxID=2772213 RepID=A0ABR9P3M4_9ACTN|nr:FAD-binding oxidoreductase [Nocardiopsis coralli]MBE2998407.1 FAD-binding oxidoreductase [Nocardiopsis coralli]